jgi:hypothetical protein
MQGALMFFGGLGALIVLAVIVTVIAVVSRSSNRRTQTDGEGGDLVSYLILALAMGVAGFALAELASTAFPGESLVFDPASELATSLSFLVVSAPLAFYFWRRQAARRARFPGSAGWTIYLAIIEVVFVTALVVAGVDFVNGLFTEEPANNWTRVVVFGAVVVFHELSARATPPRSDAGELSRVIGSAIGLVTSMTGLIGLLGAGVLMELYGAMVSSANTPEYHPWLAMVIIGAPLWWYRWLRPWRQEPGLPFWTYTSMLSVLSLTISVGSATAVMISVLQYLVSDVPPAGEHFELLPFEGAFLLVGFGVWVLHRARLGRERTHQVRAYEYLMAAIGLGVAVAWAVILTAIAFGTSQIVGGDPGDVVLAATILVVGLVVWLWFTTRSNKGEHEIEATAWPRRVYHLGLGVVLGLVAAGGLITTLFILINRLLGEQAGSLLEPGAVFVYAGLATWYLLASYLTEREAMASDEVVTPFDVTIISSHPGTIATRFPKQAKVRVLHRGDVSGAIDDEMADEIVAAVNNKSSLVWVDDDGFRIAPARTS